MLQQVAIEGIESGVVEIGHEHALAQIIQNDDPRSSSQAAKCFLMQLGPDARTGVKRQQAYRLAAVAQRQHEQPRAPILTALRVAHHGPATIIDLGFFSWCGEDDRSRLWRLGSTQPNHVSPNTLVAGAKAMVGHQILPDRSGITTTTQTQLDGFMKKLTGTA